MYVMPAMESLSDAQLHVLILAGDEDALAAWEERVRPDILRMLATAKTNPHDAEEIWNETFHATWRRLWQSPPLLPLGEALRAYAFRVASNIRAKRWQQNSRNPATVPLLDENDETVAKAIQTIDSQRVLALRRCLESAPERVRLVADLLMQRISRHEMAQALHIASTSVGQTIARAKARLAECIERGTT